MIIYFSVSFIRYGQAINIAPEDVCFINKAILLEKFNRCEEAIEWFINNYFKI